MRKLSDVKLPTRFVPNRPPASATPECRECGGTGLIELDPSDRPRNGKELLQRLYHRHCPACPAGEDMAHALAVNYADVPVAPGG